MFLYGNPVPPEQFVGRRRELRRIVSRLAYHGQSAAVVGEARSGKTSLLAYLGSRSGRDLICSDSSLRLVFSFLDAHSLPASVDHAYFWAELLVPLVPIADPGVLTMCHDGNYDPRILDERLFVHLREINVRLVVLIDEFDDLVRRRVSDPVRFFGALRSLASRGAGAIALVVATRLPLKELEDEAQRRGYSGSPPFNFMTSEILGPLSEDDIDTVLDRGRARFSAEDRRYLSEVAGGHPYLIQAAAAALWDAYEDNYMEPRQRRAAAGGALRACSADVLEGIWLHWPALLRFCFAAIVIEHLDALSGAFDLAPRSAPDAPGPLVDAVAFDDELSELQRQGFIREDLATPSRHRVRPLAFLAWCAKELRKRATSLTTWNAWLREQGWSNYLSNEQRYAWLERVPAGLRYGPIDVDFLTEAAHPIVSCAVRSSGVVSTPPVNVAGVMPPAKSIRAYLSHAKNSQDEALLVEFENHLKTLEREGSLSTWSAKDIAAGDVSRSRVDKELRVADIVLLCVSADYLASDYCHDIEVTLALQRWRLGEAQVIPIILRPAHWEASPFATLEPLPRNRKPVASWSNRDDAWLDIVHGIRRVVERLMGRERVERQ